jgi:WD40 repeat protein
LALSGSWDKTARLWEISSAAEVRRFVGHSKFVMSVAFSPDGRYALTGSLDRTARLWDVRLGTGRESQPVRAFLGHSGPVYSVAYSPDGRAIATASGDGTARVWDAVTARPLQELRGHNGTVYSVAFSRSGKLIVTGGTDSTARIWDIATGRELHRLSGHSDKVYGAQFSPDDRWVVTGSRDGSLGLWDAGTGAPVGRCNNPGGMVLSVAFSADGLSVLTGDVSKKVRLWRTADCREIRRFDGHGNAVLSVAFSPDHRHAFSASRDQDIMEWDLDTARQVRKFQGRSDMVLAVAASPDGRYIATGSWAQSATLWDAEAGSAAANFGPLSTNTFSMAFFPDGRKIVMVSGATPERRSARVWEILSGKEPSLITPEDTPGAAAAAVSADGNYVAVGTTHGMTLLWSEKEHEVTRRLAEDSRPINAVAISTDGKLLLTGSDDGTARLWDTDRASVLCRLPRQFGRLFSVALSPDHSLMLTAGTDSIARLWAIPGCQLTGELRGHTSWIQAAAFSPDGQSVLTASGDTTARWWNVRSRGCLHVFSGHTGAVRAVAFWPQHPWIITGSQDAFTSIWSPQSEERLASLATFRDEGWAVVGSKGHFDVRGFREGTGLYWTFSDDPLHAVPVEFLARDYFEPHLLPRLLGRGEQSFPSLPDLGDLNRVTPRVRIEGIRRGDSADEVWVDVQASGATDPSQSNGKHQTDAHDLRLLRNGQLVHEWPSPDESDNDLSDKTVWQERSRVRPPPGESKLPPVRVRLASADRGKPVTFSAYAFNDDRVNSGIVAESTYLTPADMAIRVRHAYVVAVGVNAYQNSKRNLRGAVADAEAVVSSLASIPGYKVIPISLLSDPGPDGTGFNREQATKSNLRSVLSMLAAPSEAQAQRLRTSLGSSFGHLEQATPDDLVIVYFSGHGYAAPDGHFYLLLSDSGTRDTIEPEDLPNLVSAQDLASWLRRVDAGQIVMILDTCHAAKVTASGTEEFKAAPLGNPGLGQLAYDKGMWVLAATQADNVALESDQLGGGLLTYALTKEGLSEGFADLDRNGRITLAEWLKYAVQRVPFLYRDVVEGRVRLQHRGEIITAQALRRVLVSRDQVPELYDFHAGTEEIVLR